MECRFVIPIIYPIIYIACHEYDRGSLIWRKTIRNGTNTSILSAGSPVLTVGILAGICDTAWRDTCPTPLIFLTSSSKTKTSRPWGRMTSRPAKSPLPKMAWLHSESLDLMRRLSQVGRARLPGPGRVDELKREIGLEAVKKTAETVTVKEHELEAMKGTAGDGRS
jgi:hypothetical protein